MPILAQVDVLEPLELETVVSPGLADEAAAAGLRQLRWGSLVAQTAVVCLLATALVVVTGSAGYVFLVVAWLGTLTLVHVRSRALLRVGLRPGSVIRVRWTADHLAVTRPGGTVSFVYAGTELVGGSGALVTLRVADPGLGRVSLHLPGELVPPEALDRMRLGAGAAVPLDAFGAAGLTQRWTLPARFPRKLLRWPLVWVPLVAVGLVVLVGTMRLAFDGAWAAFGTVLALQLVVYGWVSAQLARARRPFPEGATVGASYADGRVVLALPTICFDFPESRIRDVQPWTDEIVRFVFSNRVTPVVVPRAVVPDVEIDRLRALVGKGPVRASQRLRVSP